MTKFLVFASFLLFITFNCVKAETSLEADGTTDTYTLVNRVFGTGSSAIEIPDCNHTSFGPHITQVFDTTLFHKYVFAFHLHIKPDDDRCGRFDRQRNEIKTNSGGGGQLVGYPDDYVTLSWNFKLDSGFLPPYSFCHIHQIKAVDGDDSMPIITLTPRKSNPNELQLIFTDSKANLFFLATTPLQPFLGTWVHAVSNITYGHNGKYSIRINRISDGMEMLSYQNENIDMWRNETSFSRPKWGIYRTLQEAVLSRDEIVLFDDICVGKGQTDVCF